MHTLKMRAGGVLVAAALLTFTLSSCDFVQPTETNPNAVPDATMDQLFTGIQVSQTLFAENQMNRLAALWIDQLAGTDRQFTTLDQYVISEGTLDGEFSNLYTGGGLVDMRRAIAQAEAAGRLVDAGILKVQQAFRFGMAASIWGAIPYSEAGKPSEIETPSLDDQLAVYDAVQSLLDEAISDLSSGAGATRASDVFLNSDADAWIRVAHSLKARFHMHLAEVDPSRYAMALSEAQMGIQDPAGNWTTQHTTSSTEQNMWHQFYRERDSYSRVGAFVVDLMKAKDDPRIPVYFTTGSGDFAGAYVGSGNAATGAGQDASLPNVPIEADYGQPIITCAETQFIAAEAALQTGNTAQAESFLDAGIACQEDYWASLGFNIDIPDPGPATLEEIIEQKYVANFLNMEIWNDYKRTCLPGITPVAGKSVPGRLLYGQSERETNPNIPSPDQQPERNENDPSPC